MKPHIFRIYRTADREKIATVLIYGETTGAEQDIVIVDSLNAAVAVNLQPGYDRKGQ